MGRGAYDESVDKNGIVAEFTKDRTAREEAKANAPKPKVTRARRNNNSVPLKKEPVDDAYDSSTTATKAKEKGKSKAGVGTGKKP